MGDDNQNNARFSKLTYDDFRLMAGDNSLSRYEKIGFPDRYRAGREGEIFADIRKKLPILDGQGRQVLDIGPGCGDLPHILLAHCEARNHELSLCGFSRNAGPTSR